MAWHCRYEEVMLARQGGREGSENKWEVLRTRIMAGEEDRHAARCYARAEISFKMAIQEDIWQDTD